MSIFLRAECASSSVQGVCDGLMRGKRDLREENGIYVRMQPWSPAIAVVFWHPAQNVSHIS